MRTDGASGVEIRPLAANTWDAFAELVERNNGVFGGCWCLGNHCAFTGSVAGNRALKQELVRAGRAHAALVVDTDGRAQGWCQYGPPDELPRIKHRRAYEADPPPPPDWRVMCIFTDKRHRRQGLARAALGGAIEQMTQSGGGRVEAISEVTSGRTAAGRFLFSGSVELFEDHGFTRIRQVGKHAWIVGTELPAATGASPSRPARRDGPDTQA